MTGQMQTKVLMQIEVDIQRVSKKGKLPTDSQFQCWAEAVSVASPGQHCVAVRIVDEMEARHLNLKYRNKDYATNVLSFPAQLPDTLPLEIRQSQLGDILICAPIVSREAIEQNRSEIDHWAHLTIHGILHLLGYDHEQADQAVIMESLEKEILATLGIPDPYMDSL